MGLRIPSFDGVAGCNGRTTDPCSCVYRRIARHSMLGALTMQEAYRAIEWKAIFLVAAVLPVGLAMETHGSRGVSGRRSDRHWRDRSAIMPPWQL